MRRSVYVPFQHLFMPAQLKEFYRQYLACCNEHCLSGLTEFVHDPIQFNGTSTPLAQYTQAIASFIQAFPDFHWTLEDIVVEGDTLAVRLRDTGTHQGEWLGLAPTGRRMTTQEVGFYQIRDGKIAAMWYVLDVPTAKQQLAPA